MKTIAFFSSKGGVGRTTLVYHLAWMYAERGLSVVAVDLDPQADLSTAFLDSDRLEALWPDGPHPASVLGAVMPALRGLGDVGAPHVERVADNLGLVVGDLGLSGFEAELSAAWTDCLTRGESAASAFRAESAFHRAILKAGDGEDADLALIDVGPNLGAVNRAAILAAHFVVVPLAPDLFSHQVLRSVGPALRAWRGDWQDRLERRPAAEGRDAPPAGGAPAGYVVMQHAVRGGRPLHAYRKWIERIPAVYRREVLDGGGGGGISSTDEDPECLATLKHYRSLMDMAQDARKPMFHLRAADGALGGHIHAVLDCRADFEGLARAIAARCGVRIG